VIVGFLLPKRLSAASQHPIREARAGALERPPTNAPERPPAESADVHDLP
jgi:hypothetical protein